MRIALQCNEYPPHPVQGGIGTFTMHYARGLAGRGHEVLVFGLENRASERMDGRVRIVMLKSNATRGAAWLLNRLNLRRFLLLEHARQPFDVIEAPEYEGWLAMASGDLPVVNRLHLSDAVINARLGKPLRGNMRRMERRQLRRFPNWIAVSRFMLEETKKEFDLEPRLSRVIYNPIAFCTPAAPKILDLPSQFILFAGTLSIRKGAALLAEAAAPLMDAHPALHLVYLGDEIVEDGVSSGERIRGILPARLHDRLHLPGKLPLAEVYYCMERCAVFAFPSRLESFGLTPFEAMQCGAPVVYSKNGPGGELIVHEEHGMLADPFDASDLTRCMGRLLNEPEFSRAMARRGAQLVRERLSLDACIDDSIAFYERCRNQAGDAAVPL